MRPLMSRAPAPLRPADRVLIVRLGAVGDVVRTLPALRALRAAFPGAHLAWIVEDLSRPLLDGHPDLDAVIRFPRRELRNAAARPWRLPGAVAGLARDLRQRRFDVALDFQGSLKSALLARLSGAARRVGFGRGHARELSHLLYSERLALAALPLNRVERNLRLAESVGAAGGIVTLALLERPEESGRAARILDELCPDGAPAVILFPGTSRRQARKRWPAARYARLAALLRADPGAVPLVAWGPGEERLARGIVDASGGAAVLLPPTDLRLLAALLRRARLFIGGDTGPMHVAWAVGCPVVVLFGPTDPRLNAPPGPAHTVLRGGGAMEDLPAETVAAAARAALRRPPPPGGAAAPRLERSELAHAPAPPAP
jgi:lipopolysaccharide heptosyltransferase I